MTDPRSSKNSVPEANPNFHNNTAVNQNQQQNPHDDRKLNLSPIEKKANNPGNSHDIGGEMAHNTSQELASQRNEKDVLDKLKKQNTKLKTELRQLTLQLNELLVKTKQKKPAHTSISTIVKSSYQSEENIQKEIENAKKQLSIYQRDLKLMDQKLQSEGSLEKYVKMIKIIQSYYKMQDKVANKDREIQKATLDKKNVEKALLATEKAIEIHRKEYETQSDLNYINEQIRGLKDKIRDYQRKEENDVQQNQKREEYIKSLEARVQRAIQKTGYNPDQDPAFGKGKVNPPKRPSEGGTRTAPKKIMRQPWNATGPEDEFANVPPSEDKFNDIKTHIKIQKKADKANKIAFEKDSDIYERKIEEGEREIEDYKKRIFEKEQVISVESINQQEIKIFAIKARELNKMVRHHSLNPLDELEEFKRGGSKSRDNSMEKEQLSPKTHFHNKGFRKDERGRAKKGIEFSDQPLLGKEKTKIVSLKIWQEGDKISGIQAVYKTQTGQTINGNSNVKNSNGKTTVIEFPQGDYVKEISGFIDRSEGALECILVRSFNGDSKKVGEPGRNGKLFKFDINEMEYPACLYGVLRDDEKGSVLSKLGVLIAVDEVEEVIDDKAHELNNHLGESELNQEQPEKSLDKSSTNKNPSQQSPKGKNSVGTQQAATKKQNNLLK